MADKPQIIPFPADRRSRYRAALRAADPRLRIVARLRRVLGWVTAAALILFCAANASLFTRESLKQLGAVVFGGLTSKDAGSVIEYATENNSTVAAFADGLAVADNDMMSLQKPGTVQLTVPLGYSAPVLCTSDRYVLAYDREGYGATLTSAVAAASTQTMSAPILSGCVGQSGEYALVTSDAGYRSAVTVFSSGGKQRFRWATPDYYFQSTALSPDGQRLAVAAFRQQATELEGTLFLRELDSEDIAAEIPLGSVVPIAVAFLDADTVAVIGDYSTLLVDRKGHEVHRIDYAAGDLNAYAFGDGSLVIGLHSYSGAARTALVTVSASGRESDPLPVNEELQSLDYDGARLALLTTGGLTVYDSALRPLWKNDTATGARSACLTSDGAVWLTYPRQAERITSSTDTSEVIK